MDYGEIFVGTFRVIWHQKRLWGLGMVGRIFASLGILAGGFFGVSLLRSWFAVLPALMSPSGRGPGALPPNMGLQLGTSWALLACTGVILSLAGYIVRLVVRSAIIGEAANAWSGGTVDTRRGLRTGAGRAVYVFALDLLWWIPISAVVAGAYLVFLLTWFGAIGVTTNGSNPNTSMAPIWLGLCGMVCCLLLLGLLIAAIFGIFAPLMYQSAVQPRSDDHPGRDTRRTLGEAIAEGWGLARKHLGSMLIFWLLVAVVSIIAGILVQAVVYPFSLAALGSWVTWMSQLMQNGSQGAPVMPATPPINTGFLLGATLVQAVAGLIIYGFTDAFNLTLYAAVYRGLTGRTLQERPTAVFPPPAPPTPPAPAGVLTGPDELPASAQPEATPGPTSPSAEGDANALPGEHSEGARQVDVPEDGEVSVPDEPAPPDDQAPPLI